MRASGANADQSMNAVLAPGNGRLTAVVCDAAGPCMLSAAQLVPLIELRSQTSCTHRQNNKYFSVIKVSMVLFFFFTVAARGGTSGERERVRELRLELQPSCQNKHNASECST